LQPGRDGTQHADGLFKPSVDGSFKRMQALCGELQRPVTVCTVLMVRSSSVEMSNSVRNSANLPVFQVRDISRVIQRKKPVVRSSGWSFAVDPLLTG